jgi:uncharacterized protein (DUF305 family)
VTATSAPAGHPDAPAAAAPPRGRLRTVLLLVMAVALVVLGGAGAVALGLGRQAPPSADSVDAGFAWDMSRHHLQGVEMANLVATHSSDPVIRSLGFDISATQTNQVGRMQGWLSLWGLPTTDPNAPMAWMGGMPSHDMSSMSGMAGMPGMAGTSGGDSGQGALMPGMATEAELDHLRSLSGTAFDVEFLRLMIRHHEGGLDMAQYGEAHAQLAPVRRLATSIAQTQTAEVQTMLQLLTARGGTPLPAP